MAERLEMKVVLEDPARVSVPTLFGNHLAVSRAGTEVQFEFVAVDINAIATMLSKVSSSTEMPVEVAGKTVAKIVIPLHVFLQLETHLKVLFAQVRNEFPLDDSESEASNEHSAVI